MDPHRIYSSVCAVMVCLLGATRLSSGENCKCPAIPPKDLTVRTDECFQINSVYRYQCIPGYTRKPGTSNLIKCQEKNGPSSTLQSVRTSTSDPAASPNMEPSALGGERMTVCISLIGVILFFIVCGVIFFLYRQERLHINPGVVERLAVSRDELFFQPRESESHKELICELEDFCGTLRTA
ncbi:hypothetical protein CCH79_00001210 [Gambusia affinis]|uniref:Sushi domain-containing protein n=1 Tax=Gambusia affinis TaxID=33528 RepID=A0A315W441_GAMAF|nr:hypothetical protein CCH79_00001210 [Gambusia affinis]